MGSLFAISQDSAGAWDVAQWPVTSDWLRHHVDAPAPMATTALSGDGTWPGGRLGRTLILEGLGRQFQNVVTTESPVTCSGRPAPDAAWVVARPEQRKVSAWNLDGSRHAWGTSDRRTLPGNSSPIVAVCVAPGNTWLASVASDGRVRIWDADGGLRTILSAPHVGPEHAVRVHSSPGGTRILTAGWDGLLRLFESDGTQIGVVDQPVVAYGIEEPGPHHFTLTEGRRIDALGGEEVRGGDGGSPPPPHTDRGAWPATGGGSPAPREEFPRFEP